jgi:ubiquinone/menaquinone biosynthesis C-methylase UbiE
MHTTSPNHHAGQGSFGGVAGLAAGLTMVLGRQGDARWAIELTDAEPGERVVDVGCGPGAAVRHAARAGLNVTGVDPSPQMLRLARRLTHGVTVEYLEGAAEALPLADGAATVVWSIASVHHWSDVVAGLGEVRRVLAPGGRFAAIERLTTPGATGLAGHGWTEAQAAELARLCHEHGFADSRVEQRRVGRRRRLIGVAANTSTSSTRR